MTNGGYVPFLIFCRFWILFTFLGAVKGETSCQRVMTQNSLSGASLCYNTSGSGHRVVLDAFNVQSSSTTNCRCTVTTTHSTKVSFEAPNNLHPNQFCSSSIVILKSTGLSGISLNCFVYGSLSINPSETLSVSFEKPPYSYDANYCILLTPDNTDAILSLKCEGDILGLPASTSTTPSTTTTTLPRTTTTTTRSTTLTTTTSARPTTSTLAPTTTTTTTSLTSTTKSTSSSTVISTTGSTTTPTTTQKQSTAGRTTQSTTKRSSGLTTSKAANTGESAASTSEWSYIIPVIGAGLIVVVAIILAICYSQRKKHKNMYTHRNSLSAYESKAKSPYSSDFDSGPGMTSKVSTSTRSTYINAIVIDDEKDNASVSTNLSEGTYVRHSVRQPINNETPMYAVVDKSTKENKPVTDVMYSQVDKTTANQNPQPTDTPTDVVYSQVDKSDNQNYQPTEADVVY